MRSCEARLELMAELAQLKSDGVWSAYEQCYFKYALSRVKLDDYADAVGYLDALDKVLQKKREMLLRLRTLVNEETLP